MEEISFEPIWFDSLGAKSSCTLVRTPEVSVLIDPGAAAMQPSFPASPLRKAYWYAKARLAVVRAFSKADVIVISHYHHDHFMYEASLYGGKLLLAKDPNRYINDSQRGRAERFFGGLWRAFGGAELEQVLLEPSREDYRNPLEDLPHARGKDFGDYGRRRRELLSGGLRWFEERAERWSRCGRIPELKSDRAEVRFADGKELKFGKTRVRFTPPLFHGIEFSRIGWVFATVIERGREKLIHSSDLNGPIIEDYADWIIRESPDVLILDGPATYMLGYTLTRTTLRRAVENAVRILEETDLELMLYDHHLPREPKFRERTKEVWEAGRRERKMVLTAAEYLGKRPACLR